MASVEDAFGKEFAVKHLQTAKLPRLKLEGVIKKEIIKAVKSNLKPDKPQLHYPINNRVYHLILMKSGEEILRNDNMKFGGVGLKWFLWGNKQVSLICDEEIADRIKPDTHYVFVGEMKTNPKKDRDGRESGDVWYNLRLDGVITMEEIANFKEDEKLPE